MKKMIVRILICIAVIAIFSGFASAEEYALCGYISNGCTAEGEGFFAYLPDGLEVVPLIQLTEADEPYERIPVILKKIPSLEEITFYVYRCEVVDKNELLTDGYTAPEMRVKKRTPLYSSRQKDSRDVETILLEGDWVCVYAHIKEYYLVEYKGLFGFVGENDVSPNMRCDETYRYYDKYMRYEDYVFVEGQPEGNEKITAEEAIERANQYLTEQFDETIEHLNSLEIKAKYNISHIYGTLGTTWYITYIGLKDDLFPGKVDLYLSNQERDIGTNTADEDIRSDEAEQPNAEAEDETHLFYAVEVSVESGDVWLVASGDYG